MPFRYVFEKNISLVHCSSRTSYSVPRAYLSKRECPLYLLLRDSDVVHLCKCHIVIQITKESFFFNFRVLTVVHMVLVFLLLSCLFLINEQRSLNVITIWIRT